MTNPTIIANGTVLTCDAANRCGRLHFVVGNGRILSISENIDRLVKDYPLATHFDAQGMLIVPGFVNAHYHGESFLLRPLTQGLHFNLWKEDAQLNHAMNRLLQTSSYDDIQRVYRSAYVSHLASGTTCVGEFPPQLDESAFLHMLDGIASIGVASTITLQNWDHIAAVQSLREKRPHVAVNMGKENDLTVYSIEKLSQAAKELNAPLLAHVAEQREDVEIVRKHFQKDILTLLSSFNAIRQNTILVHANHCSEGEAATVKEAGGAVVVCARSTAAKQTGYPALRHLAKRHVRLALGTDWGSVNMLEEMRFVNHLPLIVPGLRMFSSLEILRMATINGAIALGMFNEVGSIEPGKRADAVFFKLGDVRMPVIRPTSSPEYVADVVVNHLSSGDIRAVMLNGDFKGTVSADPSIVSEFMATYTKFFSDELPGRTHEPQPEQTRNVLPFSADVRLPQDENEGFEAGFPATPRTATIVEIADTPVNPLVNRTKPQRDPIKPELPKTTRRVFGDDEDP